MKIELHAPLMDKGWSLQIFADGNSNPPHLPEWVRESILILMRTPAVKRARPFLQGDCLGWLMIEFRTDSEERILNAASFIEKELTSIGG